MTRYMFIFFPLELLKWYSSSILKKKTIPAKIIQKTSSLSGWLLNQITDIYSNPHLGQHVVKVHRNISKGARIRMMNPELGNSPRKTQWTFRAFPERTSTEFLFSNVFHVHPFWNLIIPISGNYVQMVLEKTLCIFFFPLRAESFLTLLNTVRKEVVVVSLLQKRLILLQVAATDNRVTQSTPRSSCAMWGACPKCALHNMLLSFAAWFSAVHWSFWIFGKPKHFATIKLPVEARVELCFWKTGSNENWNLQVASSLSYISSRRFLSKVLEETCSKRICQNIHTCTGQCKLF